MPTALRPENWLDWAILIYVGLGLWQGLRRGLVLSLVGIAATILALVLAVHLGPRAVQFADTRWHTQERLQQYLGRQLPLPDGAGQVPYSRVAVTVLRQDMRQAAAGPSGQALAAVFQQPPPVPRPATLQDYFDAVVAGRVLGLAAFVALLAGGEVILRFAGSLLFAGVARRGLAGLLNGAGGALVGAAERLVETMALLSVVSALAAVPAAAALTPILQHSRWAHPLLRAFTSMLPQVRAWL